MLACPVLEREGDNFLRVTQFTATKLEAFTTEDTEGHGGGWAVFLRIPTFRLAYSPEHAKNARWLEALRLRLRAGLRQRGVVSFLSCFPPLIPQRVIRALGNVVGYYQPPLSGLGQR
jgi:hypothetical protein